MLFTPDTDVYLLNTPLENNYKNQLTFNDAREQTNYFLNKEIKHIIQCTYQRKDGVLRVPYHIEDIYNVNYVMYKNNNYSTKWFYAFVTNMEYKNDGTTDLYLETDVWQTWMFDVTLKASFIEREHVEDDTIGLHTFDEGLSYGEYIVNNHTEQGSVSLENLCYYLGTTVDPNSGSDLSGGNVYNGIYSGVTYYRYDYDVVGDVGLLNGAINRITEAGKIDGITSVFVGPKHLSFGTTDDHKVVETNAPSSLSFSIAKTRSINGYTPKNNKLKTYPYCFLRASNNAGANAIYKYEYFDNEGECWFNLVESLCPGISGKIVPMDYKGVEKNYDEMLPQGKYPICNFAVDMYTNWQTQNGVNNAFDIGFGVVNTLLGGVAGAATGGVVGAIGGVMSGAASTKNAIQERYVASLTPDQVRGNLNCGDVNTSEGTNCFHFYETSIKKEYAEIIDGYFEMYGYKVNQVKVPNIKSRPYWNYIKTIDCNLDGNCPQDDLNKIRSIFDNGITFWHTGNVEDYSKNNH